MIDDALVADSMSYERYQWFRCGNDTTLILGANSFYYIPSQTGTYALAVSKGTCFEYSTCKQVIVVSTFKNPNGQFRLYPNPTSGLIQVEIVNVKTNVKGSLHSISGKKLKDFGSLEIGVNQMDISALPAGSYILAIQGEEGDTFRELVLKE